MLNFTSTLFARNLNKLNVKLFLWLCYLSLCPNEEQLKTVQVSCKYTYYNFRLLLLLFLIRYTIDSWYFLPLIRKIPDPIKSYVEEKHFCANNKGINAYWFVAVVNRFVFFSLCYFFHSWNPWYEIFRTFQKLHCYPNEFARILITLCDLLLNICTFFSFFCCCKKISDFQEKLWDGYAVFPSLSIAYHIHNRAIQ